MSLKIKGLEVSLKVLLLRVFKTFIFHSDESLFLRVLQLALPLHHF